MRGAVAVGALQLQHNFAGAIGRACFLELRFVCGAAIDPIEHQTMQMDVEIGGRAKALDESEPIFQDCDPPRPALDPARLGTTITAALPWHRTPAMGALVFLFLRRWAAFSGIES